MNHGTLTALMVTVNFILTATPIALLTFAWRSWKTMQTPIIWRMRTALAALLIETIGALAMPVVMLIQLPYQWAPMINRIETSVIKDALIIGVSLSLLAIPLAAFARGKVRWLTLIACIWTLVVCIGTGASF